MASSEERKDAFRRWIMQPGTLKKLYRLSYSVIGAEVGHQRDDLMQSALVRALEGCSSLVGTTEAQRTGWFLTILRNISINEARKRGRSGVPVDSQLLERVASSNETPETTMISQETIEGVDQAIDELPAKEQAAINLVFRYGFSTRDAANLLGSSTAAVRMAQLRAIRRLRELLKDDPA